MAPVLSATQLNRLMHEPRLQLCGETRSVTLFRQDCQHYRRAVGDWSASQVGARSRLPALSWERAICALIGIRSRPGLWRESHLGPAAGKDVFQGHSRYCRTGCLGVGRRHCCQLVRRQCHERTSIRVPTRSEPPPPFLPENGTDGLGHQQLRRRGHLRRAHPKQGLPVQRCLPRQPGRLAPHQRCQPLPRAARPALV